MFPRLRRRSLRASLMMFLPCLAVALGCQDSSGPETPGGGDESLEISVDQPADADRFLETADVQLSATLDGLADSVVWRSSRDGRLGKGVSIVAAGLSVGPHDISVTAFGRDANDSDGVSIRIETLPDVAIVTPVTGTAFPPSESVDLIGEASDRDGGGTMLTWRSSLDGVLGSGAEVEASELAYGRHTIWLIATDDEGQSDSASVELTVQDYALEFDGIDDGASTPDHPDLDLTSTWTIEFWVYPLEFASGEQYLVSKWSNDMSNSSFAVLIEDSGTFLFRTWDGDLGRGTGRLGVVQENSWQHFAVIYDEGAVLLLKDGVQLDFDSGGWPEPQAAMAPVSLGWLLREDGTSLGHLNGRMDEVRIWSVARSQDEISQTISTRLNGDEPGLMAYWRMEEGEGSQVSDITGRGRTLQLGDMAGSDAADPLWHLPGANVR